MLEEGKNDPGPAGERLLFMAVVAVALILRFHNLGVPGLNRDESLVLVAAQHDIVYILKRALLTDAHPPYFYLLVKGFLQFGASDFAVRLFSAAAGVCSVFFMYSRGRRIFPRDVALTAAALLSVYFLHIQICRLVRPHPFIILLALLSFTFFAAFIKDGGGRNPIRLLLVNLALLLLHFNTLLIVGSEMVVVFLFAVGRRRFGRKTWIFLCGSALSMAVNLPLLLMRMGEFSGFDINYSMSWTFQRTLVNLWKMSALFVVPSSAFIGVPLFALGLFAMHRRERVLAAAACGFIFIPLLTLILARYGFFYEPWHIAFIIPPLLFVCAYGLVFLLRSRAWLLRAAVSTLLLATAGFILADRENALYASQSSIFGYEECPKKIARALPAFMGPNPAVLMSPVENASYVNWYLKQWSNLDLSTNRFGPKDAVLEVGLTKHGPLYSDKANQAEANRIWAKLFADMGTPVGTERLSCSELFRWTVNRTPEMRMDKLPFQATFSAYPPEFYRRARFAENIQSALSPLSCVLFPSAFDRPAKLGFRLTNVTDTPKTALTFRLRYDNQSPHNTLAFSHRFDAEEEKSVHSRAVTDPGNASEYFIMRQKPFRTLDVTVSMTASSAFPTFEGLANTIRFNALDVAVRPFDPSFDGDVHLFEEGLEGVETSGTQRFRWGDGPRTVLKFYLDAPAPLRLDYSLNSPLEGQRATVYLNGRKAAEHANLPRQPWLAEWTEGVTPLEGRKGYNEIVVEYGAWNSMPSNPAAAFAPADGRPLAVAYRRLRVLREKEGGGDYFVTGPTEP